jgi:hypothetical protein
MLPSSTGATSAHGSSTPYALVRSWATVVQRDLQVAAIIGDLYAGRAVAYTTFLAYDEVAHHSGIERHDTLSVLRKLDRQVTRTAARSAWRRRASGSMVRCIMVNSTYYADMDEVAAFEELVGSHGGMGGSQSFPFVVPAGWRLPEQAIVGPERMHRQMRRWLADLGHERYRGASPEAWSG